MNVNDFLSHYGVKGMKWGVRKSRRGAKGESPKERAKKLSDDELKTAIARMELEQRYSRLASGGSSSGSNFVRNALKQVGNQAVSTVGNMAVQSAIKAATKK